MKALYELKDKLQMELEEIANKPELSAGDLETVHKLTDTIKNIDKICMLEEEGYSEDGYGRGGWEARGGYGGGHVLYDGGSSYRGRKRDSMGRYSRDGGTRYNGYSRDAGALMEPMDALIRDADSEREREIIRHFKSELEKV